MKIVVTVRTLNEEKNIERFCSCYTWADLILIADGGSIDKTIQLAEGFDNVKVLSFDEIEDLGEGILSNPRGRHINFLFDAAKDEKADMIIFDDCDCVPTLALQDDARNLLELAWKQKAYIFTYRMFVFGKDEWFPEMSPAQSLWAWSSKIPIRADEESYTISIKIPKAPKVTLEYPKALLHYFYPDEPTLQKKKQQYVKTGEVLDDYNPKKQFGNIEQLPEWATND